MAAPGIDVRLIGDKALRRKFERLAGREQAAIVRKAVREEGAKPIAALAKDRAPRLTGALARSIKVRAGKKRTSKRPKPIALVILAGDNLARPYAAPQEFGARGGDGTRYLTGAAEQLGNTALKRIGEAIGRGVAALGRRP